MWDYQTYVLLFMGGGLGSVLRASFGQWLNPVSSSFYWGTFCANVLACLLLGFLATRLSHGSQGVRMMAFLSTGFCGGFSTFSTFSLESFKLLKAGKTEWFLAYSFGSMLIGILGLALTFTYFSKS